MTATDPITRDPPRFPIRVPRPFWIGVAAVVLVVVAIALQIGIPIYRQQVAIRRIKRLGGRAHTENGGPEWLRRWIGDERMSVFDEVVRVDLEGTNCSGDDLTGLEGLHRLEFLFLGRTEITDNGLAHISRLPRLRRLDLRVTRVTDAGLAH